MAEKRERSEPAWGELLQDAAGRAARYLDGLDERSVVPKPEAIANLVNLGGPMPEQPGDPREVLHLLDQYGSPATVATAGKRFFGFVIGGTVPAALAANWLAGAWDQNAVLVATSPVGAALEQIALTWLVDLLRLPVGTACGFVTGATTANFTALLAARRTVLAQAGWDVEGQGLFGAPPIRVIVGGEAHPSLYRSLGMLGLGRKRVEVVPADRQGRMIPGELDRVLRMGSGPAIVCMQAGNVNSGAFDPADEICALAHAAGAWVHVDGAFGLWALVSPKHAALTAGLEMADSWATDAHKWLNVPYDSGLAFVRDGESLRSALYLSAPYLPQGETREPSQFTPEMSRRARGVEIWAALRSLGRQGLIDLFERDSRYAARFAEGLAEAGYEVLNEVVLNQVVVSFGDAQKNERVVAAIQQDGTCWCGGTVWQGRPATRISVSSWATTDADVERSLDALLRAAASAAVGREKWENHSLRSQTSWACAPGSGPAS